MTDSNNIDHFDILNNVEAIKFLTDTEAKEKLIHLATQFK